jgi:hypothetical protein
MIDDGDCGAIGGMKIGRLNRSTRRKPVPMPRYPPQIPHEQTQARTWAILYGEKNFSNLSIIFVEYYITKTLIMIMNLINLQAYLSKQ